MEHDLGLFFLYSEELRQTWRTVSLCGVLGEGGAGWKEGRHHHGEEQTTPCFGYLHLVHKAGSSTGELNYVKGLIEKEHPYKRSEYLISVLWSRQVTDCDWYELGLPFLPTSPTCPKPWNSLVYLDSLDHRDEVSSRGVPTEALQPQETNLDF